MKRNKSECCGAEVKIINRLTGLFKCRKCGHLCHLAPVKEDYPTPESLEISGIATRLWKLDNYSDFVVAFHEVIEDALSTQQEKIRREAYEAGVRSRDDEVEFLRKEAYGS